MAWTDIPDKSTGDLMDETWYDVHFKENLEYLKALADDLLPEVIVIPLAADGSYAQIGGSAYLIIEGSRFALTPDAIKGMQAVYFEAVLAVSGTPETAYAALFVNGSQVANTEVSNNSAAYSRQRSGNVAADIPAGSSAVTFDVRVKTQTATHFARLAAARLILVPTS